MKKHCSVLAILFIGISLVACGNKNDNKAKETNATVSSLSTISTVDFNKRLDTVEVDRAMFEQVKHNMSYEEVKELFGGEGIQTGNNKDAVSYSWQGNGGDSSVVIVTFNNDKVRMIKEEGLK